MKSTQHTTSNKPAKEELRAEAYDLYVKKGMSIDTIFRILPEGAVSRKTLFNWKDSGRWDVERLRYFNRAKGFEETLWGLTEIYAEAAKVNPDPQLAYSISSLVSALLNNQKLAINIKNDSSPEDETTNKKSTGISAETLAAIRELLGAQ